MPNFKYGLMYRPADLGTVPKGFIAQEEAPEHARHTVRHGVVVYDRKLTSEEMISFELAEILTSEDDEKAAAAVVVELGQYGPRYAAKAREDREMVNQAIHQALRRAIKHRVVLLDEGGFADKVLARILTAAPLG